MTQFLVPELSSHSEKIQMQLKQSLASNQVISYSKQYNGEEISIGEIK